MLMAGTGVPPGTAPKERKVTIMSRASPGMAIHIIKLVTY